MDETSQKAARGDREAMARIVAEHYAPIFRYCARQLGPDLAPDAAQETFLNAQSAIRKFDGRTGVGPWLYGIAWNTCRNVARKRRKELDLSEAWHSQTPSAEPAILDRGALAAALRQLPRELSQTVLLHEVEGLTYEEIASVLDIPVGTVKSRLHNAFAQLRRRLAPEDSQ